VPCATIRIHRRIGRRGKRQVDSAAVVDGRGGIGSGPHEWMPEANARPDLEQLFVGSRRSGIAAQTQSLCRCDLRRRDADAVKACLYALTEQIDELPRGRSRSQSEPHPWLDFGKRRRRCLTLQIVVHGQVSVPRRC